MSYYDFIFGESYNIGDSYNMSVPEIGEEVESGIRRDNTVPLDLNTPLEDPYACSGEPSFLQQDYPEQGDGVGEEKPVEDQEGLYPVIVSFETDRTFPSHQELIEWVQATGKEYGYVIVIRRSKKKGEDFVKVTFQCTLGGEHKSVATVRKTGSKKIGCPFELIGVLESRRKVWRLKVKNQAHNHTPFENLEGHAYARRLSSEDRELVGQMAEQDIPKRTIWRTLTQKNPERKLILKDIHNASQKLNAEKGLGYDPMQQLETLLVEKHFTYYTRENDTTNAVEDIFFVHKHSFTMWCAFPHVLMIDATYNTNMYKMPFVQIVGMTSTNQSFSVAHAFISSEKVGNYVWVLERIKSMLVDCMEPRVIVTDRDFALMNACDQIFPNAYKFLCRFHIQQNILRNSKKTFTDKEWKQFLRSFSTVCESPTEDLYDYNLTNFQSHLEDIGRKQAYVYTYDNWLKPYHQKFVTAWTSRLINFHQTTTNRVEGMHGLLKSYIQGNRNSLAKIVGFVDVMVDKQYAEIKNGFETSLRKVMNHHKAEPVFRNLLRKVSLHALELLYFEIKRVEVSLVRYGTSCGCQLFTSCGLPCACRLQRLEREGKEIQIFEIDVFWRKLDFKAAKIICENLDVDAEIENLKTTISQTQAPYQVKKSYLQKITQMIKGTSPKKPPVVQTKTRGRPTSKQKEQRREEAARKSSYIPSQEGSDWSFEYPRHSSYIPSQEDFVRPSASPPLRPSAYKPKRASTSQPARPSASQQYIPYFPLIEPSTKSEILIRKYGHQIPSVFHPYISKIKDVKPDGHCGFRSVAVALGRKQGHYMSIRKQLLLELRINRPVWERLFDPENLGHYDRLYQRIHFEGVGHAEEPNWMLMPEVGFLIAQRWGVIVHYLNNRGNDTIFPILGSPDDAEKPHTVVAVVFVNGNHFIHVELTGSYPMPPPNQYWISHKSDAAAAWYYLYEERIDAYVNLVYPPRDPNVPPEVTNID